MRVPFSLKSVVLVASLSLAVFGTSLAMAKEEPLKGGTLRLLAPFGGALPTLDPHATYESQAMVVFKAFHRQLYSWDTDKNQPVLDLAKSVTASPDGHTFTFKLHDNVYFHNGRKMTADDVIWSFTRILDPNKAFPGIKKILPIEGAQEYVDGKAKTIAGLKKIDDYTFSIKFKEIVDPGLLFFESVTAILPKEAVEGGNFLSKPVGLGPFVFEKHVDGSYITGTRFDKYYKPGLPYADAVKFTITGNLSAADLAFRNGELDVTVLTENGYVEHKNDPKLSQGLIEVAEMFTRHIGLNNEMKPLDDVRVRQAINYAINRDIIIDKLLKNKAFLATGWIPSSSPAFDKTRNPYPYDLAKAKALMAEAGLEKGFTLEATVTEGIGTATLEAMRPFLKRINIDIKAKVVDANTLVTDINEGRAMAWFRSNGTGPDPVQALRCFDSRTSRPACNRFAFKDAEFDKILDAAAGEVDPAKRLALVRQADAYIFEKAPVWFFNYNKAVLAKQPWIHNVGGNVTEAAILEVDSLWLDKDAPGRK